MLLRSREQCYLTATHVPAIFNNCSVSHFLKPIKALTVQFFEQAVNSFKFRNIFLTLQFKKKKVNSHHPNICVTLL